MTAALICLAQLCHGASLPQRAAPPKTLILLASGLTYDILRGSSRLRQVRLLANQGGLALMNNAVSGEATEMAVFLSVGASERMAAPTALFTAPDAPVSETVAEVAAEAYTLRANEGNAARAVYRRRYGVWPPLDVAVVHVGVPALRAAQTVPARAGQIGALGEALRAAGRVTAAYGDARAALVLMDRRGLVTRGNVTASIGPKQLARVLVNADVVAVAVPDVRALDRMARAALPLAQRGEINVLIAAVPKPEQGRWTHLGFVAAAGPGVRPRSLLLSATTHTPGIIAQVDLAPTVLFWQGLLPDQGMIGRTLQTVPTPNPQAAIARLDRQVNATCQATVPVLVGYGAFAILSGLVAALMLAFNRKGMSMAAPRFALLMAGAPLLAFLPVGVWAPLSPWLYGAAVLVVSVAIAALSVAIGRRFAVSPLGVLLTGAALVVLLDALFGSPLVSRALLS